MKPFQGTTPKGWVCLQCFTLDFLVKSKSAPLGAEWSTQWLIRAGPFLYSSIWTCHFSGCFLSIFPLTSQNLFQNACFGTRSSSYIYIYIITAKLEIYTAKPPPFPKTNHTWRQKIIDGEKWIHISVSFLKELWKHFQTCKAEGMIK